MLPYELSYDAELDIDSIVEYTNEEYGSMQTLKYVDKIESCAINLASGAGYYKDLFDIHPQLRMKHCQKHYIFGVLRKNKPMLVVAILHERMNLIQRLKNRLSDRT